MSIRIKILSTVTLIFIVLFTAIYLISSSIITDRFLQLEEETSLTHLKRMTNTLRKDELRLRQLADDYSGWDDTKEYVAGNKQDFFRANFTIETARFLDIELVLFYDVHGNIVKGESYDLKTGRDFPVPEDIERLLQENDYLLTHSTTESQYSGYLQTDEGLILLVSNPVLDSFRNGPVSGTMILAQFYNERRVGLLAKQLESKLSFLPISSPTLPAAALEATYELSPENRFALNRPNSELIQGYGQIKNIAGEPIYLFELTEKRDLFQQGQQSLNLLLGSLLIVGLVVCGGLFVLLDFLITRRLGRLEDEVGAIWTQESNLRFVTTDSKDEISGLGRSINEMLTRLRENREENKKLEAALYQASEATRLKSEFLSMMSHELRTPMNAIIGYTEIMLEDIDEEMDVDETRTMLGNIDYSGHHLLTLINEILEISKIESGHFQLEQRYFNLHTLLQNLDQQMAVLIAEKDLTFSLDMHSSVPRFMIGDESRLNQILINLLSNGIKFTSQGFVRLKVDYKDSNLRFVVQDSGIGIPEESMETIFLEFRQANASLNRENEGSGLGLAIVKKLVDANDGSIHVESQVGVGSTFTVELPFELAHT